MNRLIKYRAWDGQEIRDVWKIGWNDDESFTVHMEKGKRNQYPGHLHSDDPMGRLKLMQFTGLYDKNGNEIYEGDIVKRYCYDYKKSELTFVICDVRWGSWCYQLFDIDTYIGNLEIILHNSKALEVIGNIYENLNLLDVKR